MEEADIRLAEIKKTQYEFKRDVVSGAVNPVWVLDFFSFMIKFMFEHYKFMFIMFFYSMNFQTLL